MSLGDSKRSRYGGVSELVTGLPWRRESEEAAAIEASLERNGSLGSTGGIGILEEDDEFLALIEAKHLILRLSLVLGFSLIDFEYEIEDGNEHVFKGSTTWKQEVVAMVILSLSLCLWCVTTASASGFFFFFYWLGNWRRRLPVEFVRQWAYWCYCF